MRFAPARRQLAGLAGGQMAAGGRDASVLVRECSLNIQMVGIARYRYDQLGIGRMMSGVGHIGDPLSGGDMECTLAEVPELDGATSPNLDRCLIRGATSDRPFG